MSADRLRAEVPPVVTSLVGVVVALVSGVFGLSAHGLAAGAAAAPPTSGQLLLVVAASAGIGAVTAALARQRSPLVTSAAGLLAGQGLVHLALISGHSHGGPGHTHLAHTGADAAALRAAMDGAAAPTAALWTPAMLAAHVAAIGVTLAVVAVLAGALAWVAARVAPLLDRVVVAAADLVVVPVRRAPVPDTGYLLARGGTRAPPVAV